ncbi:MAG: TRAP transporter large permease subunit [Deltaproteobacteria bacterium]|nr:TRAP transporter large permease subunit [Deltaproteobacteria bacterium]
MVALPTIEAVWRRFTGNSMPGAAVYTQHFTLWIGFIGAMIATASKSHLALSTLDMIPPGRARVFCQGLASVLSAFINAALAYASLIMVLAQRGSTNVLEGGVPAIVFEAVMPIAFTVMAYRFAKQSTSKLARILGFAAVAVVVPFILGAFLSSYGHPVAWLTPPDFSAIFGSHRSLFVWPAALALFVGFLMGMPVFVAMAGCAMLLFYVDGTVVASVPTETFSLVQQPSLPAIPLLTIAGYLLAEGGASKRLVRAAQAWFGWMPGGLAVVTVVVCAVFTTFTGASGVTILALGGILLPALKEEGYPEGFAVGNLTASGSLGLLFPPSLPVILYGVVAGVAIDHLYIAGLLPGLVMIILVAAYGIYMGVKNKTPQHAFALKDALAALWGAKWDLGLPVLVMVVVKSGFATIVEAAALGAAYAILVELIVFRDIHPFRDLPKVLGHAAALVGSVVILLGMAMGLTNYLVDAEIPTALLNYVQSHIHSQWAFLLALNVILLVLGSVLEIYSAIVVLAPLIVPLGKAFNVEPLHLGVVFLANLELGFLFPPMGLNLLLAATRFKKPLPYLYKQALPFLVIMAIGVLLITYVPAITTGVVYALKGGP